MLIQLLDYLQSGKTYSIQELADLLHKDMDSVRVELEYLENQGYIHKVTSQSNCTQNCIDTILHQTENPQHPF